MDVETLLDHVRARRFLVTPGGLAGLSPEHAEKARLLVYKYYAGLDLRHTLGLDEKTIETFSGWFARPGGGGRPPRYPWR